MGGKERREERPGKTETKKKDQEKTRAVAKAPEGKGRKTGEQIGVAGGGGKGCTVVQNSQESRRKYWATRLSIRLFARTPHSLASELVGKKKSQNDLMLSHSGVEAGRA